MALHTKVANPLGKPKKEEVVKEAVLYNGIEVREQDWDLHYRNDALYPNLNVNFAKHMDEVISDL